MHPTLVQIIKGQFAELAILLPRENQKSRTSGWDSATDPKYPGYKLKKIWIYLEKYWFKNNIKSDAIQL